MTRSRAMRAAGYRSWMSALIWRSASGRWTLTTTSWPPGRRAACTWPMEAEAIGTSSKYSNTCSTVEPELLLDHPPDPLEGLGLRRVLQAAQLLEDVRRHHVGTGRQELAELDERRPQLVEHLPHPATPAAARPRGLPVLLAAPEGVAEPVASRHVGDLADARKVLPPLSSRHASQGISGAGRGSRPAIRESRALRAGRRGAPSRAARCGAPAPSAAAGRPRARRA